MERPKAKELVQAHNVSYCPALGAKENNKNPWTVRLLFCITYWTLVIGMSVAHNLSWNIDINWKWLRPNIKYSFKVLWVKLQISSAHVKCQINDFKCASSIFSIFTLFTSTASLLAGSSLSFHPALEECNHDKCGQQCLVTADHASGAHIPHPLDGSRTENIDCTH